MINWRNRYQIVLKIKLEDMRNIKEKTNVLDNEIRHWLYKNNYDRAVVDMLIDSGQSGCADAFIEFLNGKPDEYGQVIDNFYNDNSKLDESDYL